MAQTAKGNKKAATEDDIGLLHFMVTNIFKHKLGKWLSLIEAGADPEIVVDMTALNNVIKFIGNNGIVCQDPASSSQSELGEQIAQLKEAQRLRLVDAQDDEAQYHDYG